MPDSPAQASPRGSRDASTQAEPRTFHAHELTAAIDALESEMEHLQMRHRDLFALANAWAERYDAILAATPATLRAAAESRLQRIGIRWGVMDGMRLTREFRALKL